MAKAPRNRMMKRRAPGKKAVDAKTLSRVERKEVKKLIKGEAETKTTAWYQSYNDGTSPNKATGFISNAGWAVQNNIIGSNPTDILRLVPAVLEGTDGFNRIGQRIRVQSLKVNGAIRVELNKLTIQTPFDIRVCIFVLQHVSLKDYTNLYTQNNFNQLLDTQEGFTRQFVGLPINEVMKISDQYYKVWKRKVVTLRHAGAQNVAQQNGAYSIANSHNYYATYSMDLTKCIPKVLRYPDTANAGVPVDPVTYNAPTNTSLFMCMAYVDQKTPSDFNVVAQTGIQQTYVSTLNFKDM